MVRDLPVNLAGLEARVLLDRREHLDFLAIQALLVAPDFQVSIYAMVVSSKTRNHVCHPAQVRFQSQYGVRRNRLAATCLISNCKP